MSFSKCWNDVLLHHSHVRIEFIGTLCVQLSCFWTPAIIYVSLPYLLPHFSRRNKLQREEKQPTIAELQECLRIVIRNQILSTALHLIFLTLETYAGKPPSYRFDSQLPSFREVIGHVVISTLLREFLFYYSHRILHLPSVYHAVHKLHHRFTAPVALSAQYATVTEHFLSNVLPV